MITIMTDNIINFSHQGFCASSVLSLIFPSIDAVRQVPQSTAEHQSTVTTGALCPPKDNTLSRPSSPLFSLRHEHAELGQILVNQYVKISIIILPV